MRNTAFLVLGILLIVIESNLYRLIDRTPAFGATPSLLLPLVVFMGVHEYSIARGVALAFFLGYLLDVLAVAPAGLFTFVTVSSFLVARMAGVRLAAQTLLTKFALALVFALYESIIIVALSAIFGDDASRARALALLVPAHVGITALFAPLVFAAAERIHVLTMGATAPAEGAARP